MKRVPFAVLTASALAVAVGCSSKSSAPKKEAKPTAKAEGQAHPAEKKAIPSQAAQAPEKKPVSPTKAQPSPSGGVAPTGRSFKEGDRALGGVTASELPFYNKAQGDPVNGDFTMAMACEGAPDLCDSSKGKLFATFKTNLGTFRCELYDKDAPISVANFMGLGRGVRPFLDGETKKWIKKPFYDGVIFHRVIDGFMIQTGDRTGSGRGGPGYFIKDEFNKKLRHNGAGYLSMANRNRVDPGTRKHLRDKKTDEPIANTGSSQFFITVAATRHLDDLHAIFGKCAAAVPVKISKVRVQNRPPFADHRPFDPVKIESLTFARKKK